MQTRAAVARSADADFTIEEVDLADPQAGEVRVRMSACGICRSDLSALEGKETIQFPAVLGHEGAGVVEAVGAGISRVREGDSVVLSWSPACGSCAGCLRGEYHLCERINMTTGGVGPLTMGGVGLDRFMGLGAFCEHVVVPEAMAIPVTTQLAPSHSCLIGCGVTTGFGAAANTASVRWGESVVVFGCGGVGLAAIQGARIAGAATIIAVDPIEERRNVALSVGATMATTPEDATKRVIAASDGGVDVAIECVGKPATMLQAFHCTRAGGRTIIVGLPAYTETLELPAILLLREKSITGSIYGSANPAVDFQKLADLGASGQLNFEPLVDAVYPFHEINKGFAEMRDGTHVRVVLTF